MAYCMLSWSLLDWPLPRHRPSLVCPSCSRTAVWYSGGQPRCSSLHTNPARPSPPSPEISLEMTGRDTDSVISLIIGTTNMCTCVHNYSTRVRSRMSLQTVMIKFTGYVWWSFLNKFKHSGCLFKTCVSARVSCCWMLPWLKISGRNMMVIILL